MSFADQARLSEQHRAAQARLQAVVAADVARVFPLMDFNNLDKSFGGYNEAMSQVINARRRVSASLGASYYSRLRDAAEVSGAFTPILSSVANADQLFTSLLVTGPIAIKNSVAQGRSVFAARDAALAATAKAAQRHVINGGRETILSSVRRDDRSVGWARLTDGKPCAFCALLASRGPAYKSEATSRFKSHDGCGCTPVPVFDFNAPWPGRAEEFRRAYDESISGRFPGGDGNNKAVKAWRKRYDIDFLETPATGSKRVASELVKKATLAEPRLTSLVKDVADKNDGTLEGLNFRLKTEDSLSRKILGDVESSKGLMTPDQVGAKMFDVNRYTIKLSDGNYVDGAQSIIDDLRSGGNSLKVKNYWNVADNPYQGINIQVTTPLGEQFELQLHTAKSLEVKEGALHEIYELSRVETDPDKIAEYTRQSFDAAKQIPIPRNVGVVG